MQQHQPQGAAPDPLAPHGRMFGRYLLTERLARGGMGELFIARHGLVGFEKRVVIKKVLPHLAADRDFIGRFIDEAQVAIMVAHVNVAQVFEVGQVGDEYFLALEHVDGRDLRATLTSLDHDGARMPPSIALYVAREVASGLAYAHRLTDPRGASLGIVHCDVSPPNVMLSFAGEIKLIDFGIARSALHLCPADPDRGFGKFGYMSPEQLTRGATVDHRTDVYSTGVLLFEMLTGRRLFEVGKEPDYPALARQVVRGVHPLPGDLDDALAPFDALLAKALAPSADARFQSAAELRDAIQALLATLAPTFSADVLAGFMRERFGASGATAAASDQGCRDLTMVEVSTRSFGRVADGSGAKRLPTQRPPAEAPPIATRPRRAPRSTPLPLPLPPPGPPARAATVDDVEITGLVVRAAPRPRRTPLVAGAMAACALAAAGVLAWKATRGQPAVPSAVVTAPPATPADDLPIVRPLPEAEVVVRALDEADLPPAPR
jgi:serine/threonine-protein kinase